uniref:Putative methyltransferase n=1 Tax=viral metagenome TaxID=1070528 RepID=A0A6H1Z870_9ZZZZ
MSIDTIINNLSGKGDPFAHMDSAYRKKYVHAIPNTEVIQRAAFILHKCMDKVVLDIGCGDNLHTEIQQISKQVYGLDIVKYDYPNFHQCDVTKPEEFRATVFPGIELILCCDIIEHLSNPGTFLDTLREIYPGTEKMFCAPNFQAGFFGDYIKRGYENVNPEHVAYYSYNTMKNLLTRHGYTIKEFYWYENKNNYPHGFNEGVLFITV